MSKAITVRDLYEVTRDMVENGCGHYLLFGVAEGAGPQHFVGHEIDVDSETLDLALSQD